jgi:hypothetical protein
LCASRISPSIGLPRFLARVSRGICAPKKPRMAKSDPVSRHPWSGETIARDVDDRSGTIVPEPVDPSPVQHELLIGQVVPPLAQPD